MREYDRFRSVLSKLAKAPDQDLNNEFVRWGVVAYFKYQVDFSCELFKALLAYEGDLVYESSSQRDVLKMAIPYYTFLDDEMWLRMLRDRGDAEHRHDERFVQDLADAVVQTYIPEFERLDAGLLARYRKVVLGG